MRIQVLGSVPLTNGSGSGSWSWHQKKISPSYAFSFLKVHLHHSSKIKSYTKSQNSKNKGFSSFFLLVDGMTWEAQKHTAPYPEHWRNIIFLMQDVLPIPCGEESSGGDALRWVPQWDWSSWNSSRGFAAAAAAQPVASQFLLMFHILLNKSKSVCKDEHE
jgi:hypothetical protein